jgi:hypothetical protein
MSGKDNTTAPTTAFSSYKLEGPGGYYLWFDGNSKITAGNGSFYEPLPNGFSLLPIIDCPGSTSTCEASCYVRYINIYNPELYSYYEHNSITIKKILDSNYSEEWNNLFAKWIVSNCQGGFRWHISGDIYSLEYSKWIAEVCKKSSTVNHWIYTRSFDLLEPLNNIDNLTINLSLDKDNISKVIENKFLSNFRWCYLSSNGEIIESLREGDIIFPDYAFRKSTDEGKEWFKNLLPRQKKMVCPVDYHGKSEKIRCGPCDKCL